MRPQQSRLLALLIYIGLLFLANYLAFNQILPLGSGKGLWFYSGLASVLLGNLLITPYYIKPADAISYAFIAISATYLVHEWAKWGNFEKTTFIVTLIIFFLVLLVSFISIIFKDSSKNITISHLAKVLTDYLGHQEFIFSVLIIFALLVFHRNSANEILIITLTWALIVLIKPHTKVIQIYNRLSKLLYSKINNDIVGYIAAYQTPNIVLLRQDEGKNTEFGKLLAIKDTPKTINIAISLNYVGRDDNHLLRTIEIDKNTLIRKEWHNFKGLIPLKAAIEIHPDNFNNTYSSILTNLDSLVGIVSSESDINTLHFEVIKEENVEENKLVKVHIKDKEVLYQITNGLTKEEVVQQKNKYGYAKAKAQKIGMWEDEKNRFIPATWIPQINAPVFLQATDEYQPTVNTIGHFPDSNYYVELEQIDHLVTHNTAIIGILGVGKSMLSIELIERMIAENIKVICLDLTDQYADELSDFYDEELEKNKIEEIRKKGTFDQATVKKNVEEGGSINEVKQALKDDLNDFINFDEGKFLKIYNPAKFEVWRQDSRPYNMQASMASLTPTEMAQIISENALEICQELGMTDKARVCLVYEEAHSLIPEWTSVASEGDKNATNATARAILQGRKFGLGCFVISQRTANVTKTILNQCNTIFAMRTFDETGKNFLENYIGSEYTTILPSLRERQAVFFGKGSSCENPVVLRLNDQDEFRDVFRNKYPPPDIPNSTDYESGYQGNEDAEEDDLPF